MNIIETPLKGVLIIEPRIFKDARGYLFESFSQREFDRSVSPILGYDVRFVQDNESMSSYGVMRGLHYQRMPYTQSKLVRCVKGAVLDVAVDIRRGSPSFARWVAIEISARRWNQLLVPKGFAHGFLTISDDVEFEYKCDNLYNKAAEGSIRYDDPTINIDWLGLLNGIEPVLSEKDKNAPGLQECNANFVYR